MARDVLRFRSLTMRLRLSDAKNVILIGMGAGVKALSKVINLRSEAVQNKVSASVMICGHQRPPVIKDASERPGLRKWYWEVRSRLLLWRHSENVKDIAHHLLDRARASRR